MDDVHHVHEHSNNEGVSSALLVVVLIALVALAVFAFFSLSGFTRATPAADTDTTPNVTIQGDVIVPVTPGGTNSSY